MVNRRDELGWRGRGGPGVEPVKEVDKVIGVVHE